MDFSESSGDEPDELCTVTPYNGLKGASTLHPKTHPCPHLPEPVNVTSFGKRVCAAVLKDLKMSSSWITQMGSKSSNKHLYKRQSEKAEVETGVMRPQAREYLEPPETGKRKRKGSPLQPLEGDQLCQRPIPHSVL